MSNPNERKDFEKLPVSRMVKKFSVFLELPDYMSMFIRRGKYFLLNQMNLDYFIKYILISSSRQIPGSLSGLFALTFWRLNYFLKLYHTLYIKCE